MVKEQGSGKARGGDRSIAEAMTKSFKARKLKRYIKQVEKKYAKLLARRKAGLKRTPSFQKMKDEKNQYVMDAQGRHVTKQIARFQGVAKGSERDGKLFGHIETLKELLTTK